MTKKKRTIKHTEFVEEYRSLTTEELNEEFVKMQKNEDAGKRQKRDDEDLQDLKEKIALYRKENMPDEVAKMQEEIKQIKKEVDQEIVDDIEDQKALNQGYNNLLKEFKERKKAILMILSDRSFK